VCRFPWSILCVSSDASAFPLLASKSSQIADVPSQVGNRAALFNAQLMAGGILEHIGQVVRERRQAEHVKLVRVGAALDKSEGSLSRFESGQVWAELDAVVTAYANELGVEPVELWAEAVERWRKAS
jgi:hypothetical protein